MQIVNTLLLTGANNHDWRRTAPFCREILEASGKFRVDITTDPSRALQDDLSPYQLFFLDYNGPEWEPLARQRFLEAVQQGAGVVVLHAANNAFPGWEEYEKLVGLLWREGTGHGEFHQFLVSVIDQLHPITAGINDFVTEDELYHRLANPQNVPVKVLATAYSDPAKGGSGEHEPMLMVSSYGQGRVFHTALGHVWPGDPQGDYRGASMVAVENNAFQETLLRGAEWAATGAVQGVDDSTLLPAIAPGLPGGEL